MSLIQVYKFLDKNYDQVRQEVLDLFIQSRNKVSPKITFNKKFTQRSVTDRLTKSRVFVCVCR